MSKNPSTELAEVLGTKDKRQQVQRVLSLLEFQRRGGWALTLLVCNGRLDYSVAGNPQPKEVLDGLAMVRDNIIEQIARTSADMEQADAEALGELQQIEEQPPE